MKKTLLTLVLVCSILTACGNRQAQNCENCCKECENCCKECENCCKEDKCCDMDDCSDNAVIKAIMDRRSIRKYKETAVSKEQLQQIAECGINAPNAVNAQNWAVRITTDRNLINSIQGTYNAPALIFVAGATGVDCGLMGENMMLAAHSMGLGTVCLGGPVRAIKASSTRLLEKLEIPAGMELQFLVAVGYPDEQPAAKPRNKEVIKFLE